MPQDWDELRNDFPALRRSVYLNAAGASPTPRVVREAVSRLYREMEEGGDWHWDGWVERREAARAQVAKLIHAHPSEIAFVPNTSTGFNLIVDLIGDEGAVLAGEPEFPAVTLPWIHRGVRVYFVPSVEGIIHLESFDAAQTPKAATIAVSHVQFSNGCRLDLNRLGALKAGRRLAVSASQSLGAFPLDVQSAQVDALACAGHKWLCAGYGAGFLFVSSALLASRPPRTIGWMSVEDPYAFSNRDYRVLGSNQRVELGCPAFAGAFALGAAVEYLLGIGPDAIAERVLALNMYLTFLLEREGFTILSPGGDYRSGQTLVALPAPGRAAAFLREHNVLVTRKPEGVRIATHFFNNEQDIDACVQILVQYRNQTV
jgi:cysteine desulfurase / selenocysteine lyase